MQLSRVNRSVADRLHSAAIHLLRRLRREDEAMGLTAARASALSVLGALGVVFERPPHIVARLPHADLWMGFFRDPDEHLLAIMSEVAK